MWARAALAVICLLLNWTAAEGVVSGNALLWEVQKEKLRPTMAENAEIIIKFNKSKDKQLCATGFSGYHHFIAYNEGAPVWIFRPIEMSLCPSRRN